MIKHHTKTKGDIGLLKVQADLALRGFIILHPLSEHCPFDLVAYDGIFYRVQVKYTHAKNSIIKVPLKSNWSDKHGLHKTLLDKANVDILAIYCPNTDRCYYINSKDIGKSSISLRLNKTKSGMKENIHLAKNYTDVPVARTGLGTRLLSEIPKG